MNTAFFINQCSLGDCVSSTVALDYFKSMGYRTVCFLNSSWIPLFKNSPKIDDIYPFHKAERIIREQFNNGDVVSFASYVLSVKLEPKLADFNPKYVCPKHKVNGESACANDESKAIREAKKSGKNMTIIKGILWRLGLDVNSDYKPCVCFESLSNLEYKPIVIHTGSAKEARRIDTQLVKEIVDNLGDNVVVLCNALFIDELKQAGIKAIRTSILEMASYLKEAKVVITSDSGPMHIRRCFETPMIGLDTTFESTGIGILDWISSYDGLEVLRGQDINCSRILESVKKITTL